MFLFTVIFLIALLVQGHQELQGYDNWESYLASCAAGFLLYPVSLVLQALAWTLIISRLGQLKGGWSDIEAFVYTHLMRRIPGAIWHIAGRGAIYHTRGIGVKVALAASVIEWLLLLFTAALIYLALILSTTTLWLLSLLTTVLLITGALWLLDRCALDNLPRWLPVSIRKQLTGISSFQRPQRLEVVLCIGLYAGAYLVGGAILFLLTVGVAPSAQLSFADTVRIWALTGGISFLVSIIVPAGMGIRELTLTGLMTPAVPIIPALLIAILLRLLFVLCDLVWGGLIWAVARVLAHGNPTKQNTR